MSPVPAPLTTDRVDGLAVVRRRPSAPTPATVVLVHGAMDRAASFGRSMRRLGDLDVVAYDRRGYSGSIQIGDSSHQRGSIEQHAEDLLRVGRWATSAEPDRRLVFVGHSLGGLICLIASAVPGSSVGGPTVSAPVSAIACFEAPLPWLEADGPTSGSLTLEVARDEGAAAAAEFFYRSMVGDRTWERISDEDRDLRRAEGPALVAELADARLPPGGASACPGHGGHDREDDDVVAPLPLDGTTLSVARGGNGPEHLRRASERLAACGGVECRVLAGAPHGAHLSHPDLFADWVRSVARGVGR